MNTTEDNTSWIPTVNLRLWKLQFSCGRMGNGDQPIYLFLGTREDRQVSLAVHWFTDQTPMFALYLYPLIVAYAFWMHSHNISE